MTTLYEHPGANVEVNDGLSSGLQAQRVENFGRNGNLEMVELQTLSRSSDKVVGDLDDGESENSLIDPTFTLFTPDEEAAVLKKFDRRLVLFIALLYMLSFLDRSSGYHLLDLSPLPPLDTKTLRLTRTKRCRQRKDSRPIR